ncbi:MAG: hypothetical protein ACREMQ_16450 [Longimicrobiales bacterium]
MTPGDVTVQRTVQRLNARAWGIAMGLVLGLGLLIATNVLVIRGGPNVGAHLRLLSVYFPGYSVTFVGSLIGFVWAFVLGYALGRVIGTVYDKMIENT